MTAKGLFGELPEQQATEGPRDFGAARMRAPVRDQIELLTTDLESQIADDHPVRTIWAYVERLDLSALTQQIKARAHGPGQSPVDPRLMLALWLYATSQGVGSARALARLCESDIVYRWLCGGVSMNYHGLADFRTAHPEFLDELLAANVAALSAAGVIDLDEIVQDGLRVRASAGSGSFRTAKRLHKELRKARRLIARLKQENDDDPDATNRRIKAAQERAARERLARVEAAIAKERELRGVRKRRAKTHKKETAKQGKIRASTTDAQARVMKMPDGGYRPAYNCQIASTAGRTQIIVGVGLAAQGSDAGEMRPMVERIEADHDVIPDRYLADGGFLKREDIEWMAARRTKVYCPPVKSKHRTDPYAIRDSDGPGVAQWRRRMKSAHGKHVYKRRSAGECLNARFRQWRLYQVTVRGIQKVKTVLLMFALTNNVLRTAKLLP